MSGEGKNSGAKRIGFAMRRRAIRESIKNEERKREKVM